MSVAEGSTLAHFKITANLGEGGMRYEMATGRRPFGGEDPASLNFSIPRDQPQPVTEFKSDLPNHLGCIVRRCLEKDAESQFQLLIVPPVDEALELGAPMGAGRDS